MTTNTESLRVGELKPCPFCGGSAEEWQKYSSYAYDQGPSGRSENCGSWVQVFGCKSCRTEKYSREEWNRRTEPSPAEVIPDELPKLPQPAVYPIAGIPSYSAEQMRAYGLNCISMANLYYAAIIRRLKRDLQESQQSKATVEGEVGALEFLEGVPTNEAGMFLLSASFIIANIRALNQRLAVKPAPNGFTVFQVGNDTSAVCFAREEDAAHLVTHAGPSAGMVVTPIYVNGPAPLSAHPVSDDQQAKDAALSNFDATPAFYIDELTANTIKHTALINGKVRFSNKPTAECTIPVHWSALNQRLAGKEGEPLTETYVQTVPDKCDRIVWRNSYYHLPLKDDQQAKDAALVDAVRNLLTVKGRFHTEQAYKRLSEAYAALSTTKQEEV